LRTTSAATDRFTVLHVLDFRRLPTQNAFLPSSQKKRSMGIHRSDHEERVARVAKLLRELRPVRDLRTAARERAHADDHRRQRERLIRDALEAIKAASAGSPVIRRLPSRSRKRGA
jgi:hypothetical protein